MAIVNSELLKKLESEEASLLCAIGNLESELMEYEDELLELRGKIKRLQNGETIAPWRPGQVAAAKELGIKLNG